MNHAEGTAYPSPPISFRRNQLTKQTHNRNFTHPRKICSRTHTESTSWQAACCIDYTTEPVRPVLDRMRRSQPTFLEVVRHVLRTWCFTRAIYLKVDRIMLLPHCSLNSTTRDVPTLYLISKCGALISAPSNKLARCSKGWVCWR